MARPRGFPDAFFPKPIELASLDPTKPNLLNIGEGVEIVVLLLGKTLRVFRDLCPHMGASFACGAYDARAGLLQCPWHGYAYNADTGAFAKNPNAKTFACMKDLYASYKPEKAPELRLAAFSCELEGEGLAWVRRPGTS